MPRTDNYAKINTIGGCCRNCEDRHTACHDTCEIYQEAKAAYESKKTMIQNAKAEAREYSNYKYKKIERENKFKRSHSNGKH